MAIKAFRIVLVCLILSACGEPEKGKNKSLNDTADIPAFDAPKSMNDALKDSLQSVDPAEKVLTFADRCQRITEVVFSSKFKKTKTHWTDESPRFADALSSRFYKFRYRGTVNNEHGRGIIPRYVLKCYKFRNHDILVSEVEGWLNKFESSKDSIGLGEEADALKSPPFDLAVSGDELFILQSACVYDSETDQKVREEFNSEMKNYQPDYYLRVECPVGKMTYLQ